MANLDHFINAQKEHGTYNQAYKELQNGAKTSHWIWYIFPQLKELGFSSTAKYYGIVDFKEACDYLQNAQLFENYQKITSLVLKQLQNKIPIKILMGGNIDAQKLVSSLTLFRATASFLEKQDNKTHDHAGLVSCCDQIFEHLKNQGYVPCKKTLQLIESALANENQQQAKQPITPIAVKKKASEEAKTQESPAAKPKEQNEAKSPKATTSPPSHDYSKLSDALGAYIKERKNEWSFHYNFLGLVSVIYCIQDAIMGTDHFNSKNRELKISAAKNLKQVIDSNDAEGILFTSSEKNALADGRLGKIVTTYGKLDGIMKNIAKEQTLASPKPGAL